MVCIDDPLCTPKDPALVKFVNDKLSLYTDRYGEFIATAEDDMTLVAMMDLEQYLGREIIWVRGESFDDVIDIGTKTRLPSWARRYCTDKMKLLPIFEWWFNNIGEMCEMRIGFRFDEFDRMERFFNNSDPTNYSIPVACSTKGQKRQRHETFKWRFVHFPLIKDGVVKEDVENFWKNKYVPQSLFSPQKKIEFPVISNCVGCFHKKVETLMVMASVNPEKMNWFAQQENKGMGTWLDSKRTYESLINFAGGQIFDIRNMPQCDSGGCHD